MTFDPTSLRRIVDGFDTLLTRAKLRALAEVGDDVSFEGKMWIHGGGRLKIGDRVRFEGGAFGIELQIDPRAELVIGNDVVIGAATSIEAFQRIVLGDGCRVGAFCKILDNHLHVLRGNRHIRPPSVPVTVEANVVLEDYAVLLPGAMIGAGACIGRGAVVSRRIPPGARVKPQQVHPSREC